MSSYLRSNPRRYPSDISSDDYGLGMHSDYDMMDDLEREKWLRDQLPRRRRPNIGEMFPDDSLFAYDSDSPVYDSDSNNSPYRRQQRGQQYRRSRSRSGSRSRNKPGQGRTEHHHHHHVVIYNPTNNSNNSDPSLYTPRSQQLQQLQGLCRTADYSNRQAIGPGPTALGSRGMGAGMGMGMGMGAGAGVGPRSILPPAMQLQLQSAQNQCSCCCCMTARSHQGDCPLTGPMNPAMYPRQFGQQRLLQ